MLKNTITVKKFKERNSFKEDSEGKGKFAEDDFVKFFYSRQKNRGKILFNVSKVKEYQNIDIDFIIDNMGENELPDIDTVLANPERYTKVEVKYNGPALSSRRYAFEVISHGKPGWGKISKCDYIYTVFGEKIENTKTYRVVERGIIYFEKWKEYIENNKNSTELLSDRRPKVYQMKSEDENILNYLTQLEDMEKEGILRYV